MTTRRRPANYNQKTNMNERSHTKLKPMRIDEGFKKSQYGRSEVRNKIRVVENDHSTGNNSPVTRRSQDFIKPIGRKLEPIELSYKNNILGSTAM